MRILKELDGSLVRHVDVCERDENALNLLLRNFELNSINAEKAKSNENLEWKCPNSNSYL